MRANGGAPYGVSQLWKNGFSIALPDGWLDGVMLECFQVRDFQVHKRT
jgi:hypothetical protein